jgi:hypothetical protein
MNRPRVNAWPLIGMFCVGISGALVIHAVARFDELVRAVLWPVVVLAEYAR